MEPLVSIIIPYYKGERFIQEALGSLFGQHYPNMEIIIVNDGSPEESLAPLLPYHNRITILSQKNQGQAAARNSGLRAAKGSIIGFLDQDDMWPPGRLAKTLPYLNRYDFVQGKTVAFKISHDGSRTSSDPLLLPSLVGSALYRKSVFEKVGLFDEAMREGEDFDWNVRLNESDCHGIVIPDTTLLYRKHGQNYSITAENFVEKGVFASIRKKLARESNRPNPHHV
jgi:glycosyltransferase involved in cell wall biosynthesis